MNFNGNINSMTDQQIFNMMKTAAAAVVVGYIATKVVSVVTSVAFAVLFGVALYQFATNVKYRSDDTLDNVKNLAIDTVATITDFIARVTAIFRVAHPS